VSKVTDNLNKKQAEAATHVDGPMRVIAGAGTGKTRVLTHRIAYLIAQGHADPEAILALTFTNKAASEMTQRVAEITNTSSQPKTSTFHALGAELLRRHANKLSITNDFTIRDSQQTRKIIKQATKAAGHDPQEWSPKDTASFISRQKSAGQTLQNFRSSVSDDTGLAPVVAEIWPLYKQKMREQDSVDFADLLLLTRKLLTQDRKIKNRYQNRWQYLLVDEYQDTNILQADIISLLAGDNNNVFVVGDGDQTIYSWRGATRENIVSFDTEFPGAKTVILNQNYRSTGHILQAANDVIAHNDDRHEKELTAQGPTGNKLQLETATNAKHEAQLIAQNTGPSPADWAVLYRTNAQSRVIEEALLSADIPYDIAGTSFFDRKEVRDLLAYIRLSLNRDADADRRRIINRPRRGIGDKTLQKVLENREDEISDNRQKKLQRFRQLLDEIAQTIETKPPSEAVLDIITKTELPSAYDENADDRKKNMQELATMAANFDDQFTGNTDAMKAFLQDVVLASDQDRIEGDNGVQLMTVHAAKGLEFPSVWITGLEDGLFPQNHDEHTEPDEEERRLFYVALTRAQKQVVLSYAQMRRIYGKREHNAPSPFLDHIDDSLIEDPGNAVGQQESEDVIFFD
jgi:DNA helicase-2/ATP-dependent DNA helicase PcrA